MVPGLHKGGYNFIIHLGVGRNGFIALEKRAHLGGYYRRDIHGKEGPLESRCVYVTKWDVNDLVHQLTQLGLKVHIPNPLLHSTIGEGFSRRCEVNRRM